MTEPKSQWQNVLGFSGLGKSFWQSCGRQWRSRQQKCESWGASKARQTSKWGHQSWVKSILQFIEDSQSRWYGHTRRMTPSRTAQRCCKWKPDTTRPRVKSRKRWMDNIQEAVESRGSTLTEIKQSALFEDRREWKTLTLKDISYIICDMESLIDFHSVHYVPRKFLKEVSAWPRYDMLILTCQNINFNMSF